MRFRPEEALFLHTTDCNLTCAHCHFERKKDVLPIKQALKFVSDCRKHGIKKIGFTGGEPFMAPRFMYAVIRHAVKEGMLFDRIMTNGVWFNNTRHLTMTLGALQNAGYDGSICISVDAFHNQNIDKVAHFIKAASAMAGRCDLVSITYTRGHKDGRTAAILQKLARILNARIIKVARSYPCIKNKDLFIRIYTTELSPVGKAGRLKKGWADRWFKEDYCKGPGNILFVLSNGDVKPCCGYASELPELTIGNIKKDSVSKLIKNASRNRFVSAVFTKGLTGIRKELERSGIIFPGKAPEHCFFCYHILTKVPKSILCKALA